jgi:hypothetical protein
MLQKEGCWNEMGDALVPALSPVADRVYWQAAGALLALILLTGDCLHPVSPALVYALLSNVQAQSNPSAPMDISLGFIQQLQSSKAEALLPWMIIPPGQDWKDLPGGHRTLLRDLIAGLGLEVSNQPLSSCFSRVTVTLQLHAISTQPVESHVQWTAAIVTSSMFGSAYFFSTAQFQEMAKGFRKCIEGDSRWSQVGWSTP